MGVDLYGTECCCYPQARKLVMVVHYLCLGGVGAVGEDQPGGRGILLAQAAGACGHKSAGGL